MTDTTTIPQINSQWSGSDPRILTVTGITTINGKPNVQYQASWPDRDDKGVGVADLDYFLAHHTEVTAPCRCHQSRAAVSPTLPGHCCFVPATQTCHPTEVDAWTEARQ